MSEWILLFVAHFIGDFVVQTDWQARNKWKRWEALVPHVATYTVVMGFWVFLVPDPARMEHPVQWLLLNSVLHLVTDAVTSQGTHYYSTQEPPQWHNFFIVVGGDQTIHYVTMIWSWYWLQS